MPDSYPFPIFSGLLEPKHYKQIGSALWLFLWCISSTTKEIERDGVTWGVVLGNKPIRINELEIEFGVTDKTVRSWIKTLEAQDYLKVTRAPYGLIFTVKNSKKYRNRSVENDRSSPVENYRSPPTDRQKTTDLTGENYRSNKDITEILNNVVVEEANFEIPLTTEVKEKRLRALIKIFCNIHKKFDIQINPKDIPIMQKVIALGVPIPLITEVMNRLYLEKNKDVSSFRYYELPVLKAWELEKSITAPVPSGSVAIGYSAPASNAAVKNKQALINEEAKRKIKEAEERERARSQENLHANSEREW